MVIKLLQFKTQQQQVAAKKRGLIDGHFGKVSAGRPKKNSVHRQVTLEANLPMNSKKHDVIRPSKKGSSYINWALPENFAMLKSQVIHHIRSAGESDDKN